MMSFSVWLPGPMFLLGVSLSLVPCSWGGLCEKTPIRKTSSTHPTGMLSCLIYFQLKILTGNLVLKVPASKFRKLGTFPILQDRFNRTKVTTVHEKHEI